MPKNVYYPLLSCLGALSAILVYLLGRKLNPSAPLYLVTIFPLYRKKISENTKLSMGLVTGFLILLILLPSLSLGLTLSNVVQNSHPTSQYTTTLKIITYNILGEQFSQSDPANQWINRRVYLANFLNNQNFDFLGVQEPDLDQISYLNASFSSHHYNWTGEGKINGTLTGEIDAIFYDMDKFQLLKFRNFLDFPERQMYPVKSPWKEKIGNAIGQSFKIKTHHNRFFYIVPMGDLQSKVKFSVVN